MPPLGQAGISLDSLSRMRIDPQFKAEVTEPWERDLSQAGEQLYVAEVV